MSRELLFSVTKKDLRIDYFSGSGAGGQHRNKHQNCVRIFHKESGAMVTGQSHKERRSNIKEALNNLVKDSKFRIWHVQKVSECLTGKKIKDIVEEMMDPRNIITEVRNSQGKWEIVNDSAICSDCKES